MNKYLLISLIYLVVAAILTYVAISFGVIGDIPKTVIYASCSLVWFVCSVVWFNRYLEER